jgi:RNA polymerase sigma-70 factor (ECF subfamily)
VSDESEWIQLSRQGDRSAFGHLVETYQTAVYNLAYRMLGNRAEAEDAAQEAFIRAYTHLGRYDADRSFRTWLLSITSHYCIDRLRRRRINWLPLEEELAAPASLELSSPSPNPMSLVMQRERDEMIQRMLASLSPTDRAAITLCYWYDCSYEEIAEVLGLSVSAVKSRLYRARRALAETMQHQEVPCAL